MSFAIWFACVVFVQLALLTLWFDSSLFAPLLEWCKRQYKPTGWRWYVFTLLTCPVCLGYWLAWLSTLLCMPFPGCPIVCGSWVSFQLFFVVGLAAAVCSRVIDAYMPTPIYQTLVIMPQETKVEEPKDEEHKPEEPID